MKKIIKSLFLVGMAVSFLGGCSQNTETAGAGGSSAYDILLRNKHKPGSSIVITLDPVTHEAICAEINCATHPDNNGDWPFKYDSKSYFTNDIQITKEAPNYTSRD